jgi:two-component system cell cycle sensor histidine kinase/response regulator CckA
MAAVYGIVKSHDGWIWVDSELGKGTAVRIYFPPFRVEKEVKEVEERKTELIKGIGTILVIEDEEPLIKLNRIALEKSGYHVLKARTGREAVNLARTFDEDIDLAILDIVLPDMNGRELYARIKKVRSDLKVIVCSGHDIYSSAAEEIMCAGAQSFIQKPYNLVELLEKVKDVLVGR